MLKKQLRHVLKKTLFLLLMLVLLAGYPARAQDSSGVNPINDLDPSIFPGQLPPLIESTDQWTVGEGAQPLRGAPPAGEQGVGASDDYGYTWDDTVPVDWVDATNGTQADISGSSSGKFHGPVEVGFAFPYYEGAYTQVWIGGSGFLTFSESGTWPSQSQIPAPSEPNNVVAPYWAPMYLSSSGMIGQIYFFSGGQAPDRYFVVEWYQVAGGAPTDGTGGDDQYHFQVILYENGDMRFQYLLMNYVGSSYCGAAGIEDSAGEDGLAYLPFCTAAPSNRAVLFSRPEPAARVRVSPHYQSDFVEPGSSVAFSLLISNLGDLGPDTFDLTAVSNWPLTFFDDDGLTPLTDTNEDGNIDTGPMASGEIRTVILKVSAPAGLSIGAHDQPTVTANSSLDLNRSVTVSMQAAVPARFAQVYRDNVDGAMQLFSAGPQGSQVNQATGDAWWGYNMAVAETHNGGLMYLWQRYRYRDDLQGFLTELEMVLLDHAGKVVRPVTRLTDHSGMQQDIYDEEPVLAVAPDGVIGVAWRRRVLRESVGGVQENWNIYTATLNEAGEMLSGPVNLTQNTAWYGTNPLTYGVPRYWNLRLEANAENLFALTWRRESQKAPSAACASNCKLDDVYYAIWTSLGDAIKTPTQLTTDTVGQGEGYYSPSITPLSEDRWLVVYNHNPGGLGFSVLNSQGDLIRGQSYIGKYGWSPVAKQIPGTSSILIAWTAWTSSNPQIHMLALNSQTYQRVGETRVLTNPAASTGGDYASMTVDANGRAILTWMDYNANNRRHLYYALLTKDGALITPPMIFQSAVNDVSSQPHIETGFSGYSSTTNRQFVDVAQAYWAAGWIERLYDAGLTTGCTALPPRFCPGETTTRAQMAVFLGRALYGVDFAPPDVSEPTFTDVPAEHWAAPWIEQLYTDGITQGCGVNPRRFCPEADITRSEMAAFLVRVMYGPDYVPPAPSGVFVDLPADYWAAPWIEQLYQDGITTGCSLSPLRFCPEGKTTRAEMAVFLGRTFDIP